MVKGLALIFVVSLVMAQAAFSEQSQATNKTVITSDRMTYDYKRSMAVFEGNVVVLDPQMNIKSDKLTVLFDSKTNSIKSATATGNVNLLSGDRSGTCKKAIYFGKTAEVMLAGNAVLKRANLDTVSSELITFYLDSDTVTCEQGELMLFSGGDKKSVFGPADDGKKKLPANKSPQKKTVTGE